MRIGERTLHLLLYTAGFIPFFSKENARLVVGYIVDLALILCCVFSSSDNMSPGEVRSVINNFAGSSSKTSIHAEICHFFKTVHRFEYQENDVVLAKIIDLIRQNCDLSFAHE